jgi:hypothetical protein
LADAYGDQTIWMKMSEIGRYWAAMKLTEISHQGKQIRFDAPFDVPRYTVKVAAKGGPVRFAHGDQQTNLRQVASAAAIDGQTWFPENESLIACFDLPKGKSVLEVG